MAAAFRCSNTAMGRTIATTTRMRSVARWPPRCLHPPFAGWIIWCEIRYWHQYYYFALFKTSLIICFIKFSQLKVVSYYETQETMSKRLRTTESMLQVWPVPMCTEWIPVYYTPYYWIYVTGLTSSNVNRVDTSVLYSLLLNLCYRFDQFQCVQSGYQCIWRNNVCDGKPDCRNGEDEQNCHGNCRIMELLTVISADCLNSNLAFILLDVRVMTIDTINQWRIV